MSGGNDSLHQFPYAPGLPYDDDGFLKVATAPPLPNVTRAHLPRGYDDYKPPLLHFGWSFRPKALFEWGPKNGIDTTLRFQEFRDGPIISRPNTLSTVTSEEAMKILAEKAGAPELQPVFKMSVRANGNFLIAISSNYSFLRDRKTITQARIDALNQYLKEQGIVEDPPAWHLDYEHHRWQRIY